jgi:MFS family permease
LSYAAGLGIPLVLIIGFLYDIVGRRVTTVVTFMIGAVATILIPVVSPSVPAYDVVRILFIQTCVVMLSNPFINDYVTVQSRGVATGFQTIGLTVGNLISVGGLFTLTEMIDNKIYSYAIMAFLQLVWAVLVYFMITEPTIYNEKEAKRANKKSFCGRLFSMLRQAYRACKQDHALLISLIGLIPSRNTANLQQSNFYIWIAAEKFGLSAQLQKDTWQKQNIISNACALPMVFLIGRLSDRVSPKILVPAVLTFQIIVMTGYMFCEDPTSWYAYFLSAF